MTTKELETLINKNLSAGDSHEQIESFFKANGFGFDYDRFNKRYQSGYPPARNKDSLGVQEDVVIYVYVNDDKTFKKAIVEKVYTYF